MVNSAVLSLAEFTSTSGFSRLVALKNERPACTHTVPVYFSPDARFSRRASESPRVRAIFVPAMCDPIFYSFNSLALGVAATSAVSYLFVFHGHPSPPPDMSANSIGLHAARAEPSNIPDARMPR